MHHIPRLSLSLDAFIHSCAQAQKGRTRGKNQFHSHLQYEPFLMDTPLEVKNLMDYVETLHNIVKHHRTILPHYRREETINSENLPYFALSVSTLCADIQRLTETYYGAKLPAFERGNPPLLFQWEDPWDSEKIAALLPNLQGEVQTDSSPFAQNLWDLITSVIQLVFSDYGQGILAYVSWKYGEKTYSTPKDYRIYPPVGQAFFKAFKSKRPKSHH